MVEKICETCEDDKNCNLGNYCTRHWTNVNLSEEEKSVNVIDAGVNNKADCWSEGTKKRHFIYRINKLEEK